jgi:N-acyl-D-amino-acid deacylase
MNVALMVGHNSLRRAVMGEDHEREATASEVARMADAVRAGMQLGAWGLGAGLEYRPGRFSATSEVIALARVVAEFDGFYVSHQRSEATLPLWQVPSLIRGRPVDGLMGLEETIEIARQTGVRAVASHQKARGRSSFGRSQIDTRLVDEARAAGLQVFIDVYSYDTFGSGPRRMIPAWALVADSVDATGGEDAPVLRQPGVFAGWRNHLTRRWADSRTRRLLDEDIGWLVDHNGGADRVFVVEHQNREVIGKTLADLSQARRLTPAEVVIDLAMTGQDEPAGGALMRGKGMLESDVEHYMRQEYAATSSDAQVSGVPDTPFAGGPGSHPRHFGAFTRKIAHYVRDRGVISLPFAIRASTSLPAQIIGLKDRGLVREGFKADLVVFDETKIRDRSTILQPAVFSEGVEHVLVNGRLTVEGGRPTGALAGRIVRRSAQPVASPSHAVGREW